MRFIQCYSELRKHGFHLSKNTKKGYTVTRGDFQIGLRILRDILPFLNEQFHQELMESLQCLGCKKSIPFDQLKESGVNFFTLRYRCQCGCNTLVSNQSYWRLGRHMQYHKCWCDPENDRVFVTTFYENAGEYKCHGITTYSFFRLRGVDSKWISISDDLSKIITPSLTLAQVKTILTFS